MNIGATRNKILADMRRPFRLINCSPLTTRQGNTTLVKNVDIEKWRVQNARTTVGLLTAREKI